MYKSRNSVQGCWNEGVIFTSEALSNMGKLPDNVKKQFDEYKGKLVGGWTPAVPAIMDLWEYTAEQSAYNVIRNIRAKNKWKGILAQRKLVGHRQQCWCVRPVDLMKYHESTNGRPPLRQL